MQVKIHQIIQYSYRFVKEKGIIHTGIKFKKLLQIG